MRKDGGWLSPEGHLLWCTQSHVVAIIGFPRAFGVTSDHVEAMYSDHGEPLGQEANARDELIREAGYVEEDPFSFQLRSTPSHYGDTEVNMAEVLRSQFEKSDLVEVNLKSAEWSTYIDNFDSKSMPAFLLGWYPDYMDPDNYTAAFAGTAGSKGMGIYFSDSEWDQLFSKEQGTPDQEVRKQVFEQLQQMWTEEVPTAPIAQGQLYIFTQPNVEGVKVGTDMVLHYNTLRFTD